jgi:1-phosphatidylinositol phosphodiesterase
MMTTRLSSLLLRGAVAALMFSSVAVQAQILSLSPDYEMQKRFQPDWRNPSAITLPNSAAYAQPKDFQVILKLGSAPVTGTVYTWILTKGKEKVTATGANPVVRLTAGTWNATVTGKVGITITTAGTLQVIVKDLLIVAIGDSYASGEGAPEIPAYFGIDDAYIGNATMESLLQSDLNKVTFNDFPAVANLAPIIPESWARSTDPAMALEHRLAHRSTHCYSARYAMALENSDPHISVTYVSVAQSGAVVSELINTKNTSSDDGVTLMPIQLTELKKIVGNRKIDKLLISIGGNDLGFGPLIAKMLASPVIFAGYVTGWDGDFIDPISLAPKIATNSSYRQYIPSPLTTNDFPQNFASSNAPIIATNIFTAISTNRAVKSAFQGLDATTTVLASSYKNLDASLRSLFAIDQIAITEYPDINRVYVQGTDGKPVLWWAPGVTDLIPTMAVNPSEAMLATRLFAEPLNRAVSNAAASNNWIYVGGVSDVFAGHGYGAPKDTRWIVTARESLLVEGATPEWFGQVLPLTSFGMAHQNARGLVATARLVASRFGDTNAANGLAAEVTLNGVAIGSSTLTTPVNLGEEGRTNEFLISDTTGSGLGISSIAATGGFSLLAQSNLTLPAGGSTNFSVVNPSNGATGLRAGIVTITFTNDGVLPYAFPVSAFNDAASSTKWMSKVPDAQSLSRMTIPGTHETMALYENLPGTAICQTNTLSEQLNYGIRCLDIRGRHLNNALPIHHGVVYQNANFSDVLDAATSFLSNNPTETIVMLLKEEYTASGNTRSYEDTVKSYLTNYPAKYFYNGWKPCTKIPTLGEARGKIVLARRFPGKIGINATPWPDNANGVVNAGSLLRIQDLYKLNYNVLNPDNSENFDKKWSVTYDGLLQASEDTEGKYFHLTYSSGAIYYLGAPQIPEFAYDMNPRVNGFFKRYSSGIFGVVMMDFITPELTAKVYRSGIAAIKAAN